MLFNQYFMNNIQNSYIKKQSNFKQPNNQKKFPQRLPQLSYIPTEIDLDLCASRDVLLNQGKESLKNNEQIKNLIAKFSVKLRQMIEESKLAQRNSGFFEKAGTTNKQILEGLYSIETAIKDIVNALVKQSINYYILKKTFQFFIEYFGEQQFNELNSFQKSVMILDFQSKMRCCLDLLSGSLTLPYDITTLPKQKYQNVWKHIKFQVCGQQKKVADSLAYMKRILGITTSAVLDEQQKNGAFTKALAFSLSYPQYFFSDNNRQLRSLVFYRNPTIQVAQKIWNLPQNGLTARLTKLSMKNIQTNIKIYIPFQDNKLPQDICSYNIQAVVVRIIYDDKLIDLRKPKSNLSQCCGLSDKPAINKIIVHMHGGGFVALSSRSMQTYTRKWAKQLNVPVFSIDYRMPPFYRFPTAPYDCFRVYCFIVNHIHRYFNIDPTQIILAGDSAGGNLACSLMGLILKYKLPIPKGILLSYPACDLRRIFSPSRIYSFTDPLLNPPMLMLCLKQYLNGKVQLQAEPLASPIFFTEEYVNGAKNDNRFPLNWPKTIIQVGAKDPLYDDSLRLMQRLVSSNVECQCQVYQNLSHGFLNLDFVVSDCVKTIQDSINHLKKLLM